MLIHPNRYVVYETEPFSRCIFCIMSCTSPSWYCVIFPTVRAHLQQRVCACRTSNYRQSPGYRCFSNTALWKYNTGALTLAVLSINVSCHRGWCCSVGVFMHKSALNSKFLTLNSMTKHHCCWSRFDLTSNKDLINSSTKCWVLIHNMKLSYGDSFLRWLFNIKLLHNTRIALKKHPTPLIPTVSHQLTVHSCSLKGPIKDNLFCPGVLEAEGPF